MPLEMKETLWVHFQVLFSCFIVCLKILYNFQIFLKLLLIHVIG